MNRTPQFNTVRFSAKDGLSHEESSLSEESRRIAEDAQGKSYEALLYATPSQAGVRDTKPMSKEDWELLARSFGLRA